MAKSSCRDWRREWRTVIADKTTLELQETYVDEERLECDLGIDGKPFDRLTFTPYYHPHFSVCADNVAIFCDMRIYLLHLPSRTLTLADVDEPIHAAYWVEGSWCLVCETGIGFLDASLGNIPKRWEHGEVIINSWWTEGDLHIEDFETYRYRFSGVSPGRPLDGDLEYAPTPKDADA